MSTSAALMLVIIT